MKLLLHFLLSLFLLSSCVQYQYLTVAGVNIPKNEKNQLISENDTVKVQYLFTPGQVSVRLYNKLQEPLEVIWNKSALVFNDQVVGYYNPKLGFAGQLQANSRRLFGTATTTGEVKGELQAGEQVQFIPPLSYIESKEIQFPIQPLTNLPEEKATKASLAGYYGNANTIHYKQYVFEKDTSPAHFRSYLTFRLGKIDSAKEFSVEHQFYISDVWKSAAGPRYFRNELVNRSDRFYFSHH